MDRIVPSSVSWHWDSTASGNWGPLFKYQAVHDGLDLYPPIYSPSGEILLHDEASQNIPSQHHGHREAVRTRFIKHISRPWNQRVACGWCFCPPHRASACLNCQGLKISIKLMISISEPNQALKTKPRHKENNDRSLVMEIGLGILRNFFNWFVCSHVQFIVYIRVVN